MTLFWIVIGGFLVLLAVIATVMVQSQKMARREWEIYWTGIARFLSCSKCGAQITGATWETSPTHAGCGGHLIYYRCADERCTTLAKKPDSMCVRHSRYCIPFQWKRPTFPDRLLVES